MSILKKIKGRLRYELEKRVRNSTWFKDRFPDCEKFWKYGPFAPSVKFNLDVVNLGSTSGACAFDYSGLPVHAENWALRHNPLAADLAILENYSSYLKPGATVIFPLCPFSTLSGSYDFQTDRYYTILNPRSIPMFSRNRLSHIMAVKDHPVAHYPLMEAIRVVRQKLRLSHRRKGTCQPIDFEKNAEQWIANWLAEFGLESFSSPLSLVNKDGIGDAIKYITKVVEHCNAHRFRPVFVIPPMHQSLARRFTPEARKMLIDPIATALKPFGFSIRNYMDDAEFGSDDSLFKDAFLLNPAGAKKFTQRILKDFGLLVK